jgi:alpha-tubulin suppressor-like RCC1 family protein
VYGFGAGTYGQLGNGRIVQSSDPILATALKGIQVNFIAAGPSHSIALSTQGKVNRLITILLLII